MAIYITYREAAVKYRVPVFNFYNWGKNDPTFRKIVVFAGEGGNPFASGATGRLTYHNLVKDCPSLHRRIEVYRHNCLKRRKWNAFTVKGTCAERERRKE